MKPIDVFTSKDCPKCEILKKFLTDKGIQFRERRIDDPENMTDAIMLDIYTVPAMVKGSRVLRTEEMFSGSSLREDVVLRFIFGDGDE
ncbi:MAG: glutaredoxin family protein [Candidatus Baldrarchaeia archaeon]